MASTKLALPGYRHPSRRMGLLIPLILSGLVVCPVSAQNWEPIFADGFEGHFPGPWQLYGTPTWDDEHESCISTCEGSWMAWCAGSSTPCGQSYANNMNAWMVYGRR